MKYYKGAGDNDKPLNGGKFVVENGFGHEEFNFLPVKLDEIDEHECIGFVEPKSNRGKRNTLHIENIKGCATMKDEDCVDDVLVIWCATRNQGDTTVVGWYKNATVWRDLQDWVMIYPDDTEEDRAYNVRAKASDCVLLPESERNRHIWSIPSARYTKTYGFGQSMLWYPTQPEAETYINNLVENILNYKGENWIDEYPEE